jgi:hypothetical protein
MTATLRERPAHFRAAATVRNVRRFFPLMIVIRITYDLDELVAVGAIGSACHRVWIDLYVASRMKGGRERDTQFQKLDALLQSSGW